MSEIRFIDVCKSYPGSVEVIRNLNLQVEEGEFMVLVGPSGCAKSTTLRMIAGLEDVTEGDLLIGGKRANDLTPGERNISMVFQSYALFPNMTVRENLAFGLQIRKTAGHRVSSEVSRVADMLGLHELLDRKPKQLSGGQAQRVALGRAMIRQPSAFLFDEPLSNLDAELRVQMRSEITQMQRQLGTTTVYVTHDQVEAMTMGDRIAVMDKGQVQQVGPPIELYEKPANLFVAGFIGSPRMNLHTKESLLRAAKKNSSALDEKFPNHAVIGVRPENILLQDANQNDLYLGLGTIQRQEDLGHEILAQLMTESGLLLTVRTDGKIRHQNSLGDKVPISVSLNNVHAFSAEAGNRLT
ncbi:MAG: ABC transporter ATP-binding protein [bacterium]